MVKCRECLRYRSVSGLDFCCHPIWDHLNEPPDSSKRIINDLCCECCLVASLGAAVDEYVVRAANSMYKARYACVLLTMSQRDISLVSSVPNNTDVAKETSMIATKLKSWLA